MLPLALSDSKNEKSILLFKEIANNHKKTFDNGHADNVFLVIMMSVGKLQTK